MPGPKDYSEMPSFHDEPDHCHTCHGFGAVDAGDGRPEGAPCPECNGTGASVSGGEDDLCPECGAPPGLPCDPGCPNAETLGPDPDRKRHEESVSHDFDKFMASTLIKESRALCKSAPVSPQRQLARNYQEHPLGKIKLGGKR